MLIMEAKEYYITAKKKDRLILPFLINAFQENLAISLTSEK